MIRTALPLLLLMAGLVGCAPTRPAVSEAVAPTVSDSKGTQPCEAVAPTRTAQQHMAAVRPAPSAKDAPRRLLPPEVLVGRTDQEISRAFGKPALQREESPADVWLYLAPDCALHLFFYPDENQVKVVRHVAINGRRLEGVAEFDRLRCFNDYLRAVGAEKTFAAAGPS